MMVKMKTTETKDVMELKKEVKPRPMPKQRSSLTQVSIHAYHEIFSILKDICSNN